MSKHYDKVILHAGLQKTASTYLQSSVWPKVPGYTFLSRPYTQHNHAFNQLQYADDTLYKKDLLVKELKQIGANRLILSDENFSGKGEYFSYINRSMTARRLKELFPKAEIVLFLRDQKDLILSYYSSYIKMPYGTKPIEDFYYKPHTNYSYSDYINHPNLYDMSSLYYNTNDYFIHLDCFLYSHLIDLYNEMFDKVHVFLYEDFKRDQLETISRIEEIVGERIQIKSTRKRNVSLSCLELEKLRRQNIVSRAISNRYLRKIAKEIVAKLTTKARDENDLKKLVHEIVGQHYSEDNSVLKTRLPYLGWDNHPNKYT